MDLLRQHKVEQERERLLARDLWVEKGYVFTSPTGEPLNPNTDFHTWKDLLKSAEVRDGRLHDARHTAATVLMILGVPEGFVDRIMGWEPGKSARMRRRYQHLTGQVLQQTAAKVGGLLWGPKPYALEPATGGAVPGPSQITVPVEPTLYVAILGDRRIPFLYREHADTVVSQWGADRPGHPAEVEEWDWEKWSTRALAAHEPSASGYPTVGLSTMPTRSTFPEATGSTSAATRNGQ
ncbi:tyrosine-type recombinase/integrase [Streptomyces zagrosensis]|uniref:Tyr recombinase domain-containing protein n=1 Tax=Streptomyces zagrosensis TaxID=1042984 RepID=A0A7W9Q6E3_9ACTN|nr:tyrosine-type recombinase/integrase [Streptomyces zagrosensis]MBB5934356.1 hypothetical protein [Streptomyces zagrosensis]